MKRTKYVLVAPVGLLILAASIALGQLPSTPSTVANASTAFAANLAAARRGDVQAQLAVAKAYYQGANTHRNQIQAFQWFQAASQQGSLEATSWMGYCLLRGRGVAQNQGRGLALLQQTALGSRDPAGLRLLGIAYEKGYGTPPDLNKAVDLFEQAASLKDGNALDRLGRFYLEGLGVPKDKAKARQIFLQGAALGDQWSQLSLAEMDLRRAHHNSAAIHAVPEALKLLTMSAAQGNRRAAFRLAEMYQKGQGTTKDPKQAVRYFQQSALLGYSPAQRELGRAFEQGQGTAVNLVKAYVWYGMAAQQGDDVAAQRLPSVAGNMAPVQVTQAQAALNHWSAQFKYRQ